MTLARAFKCFCFYCFLPRVRHFFKSGLRSLIFVFNVPFKLLQLLIKTIETQSLYVLFLLFILLAYQTNFVLNFILNSYTRSLTHKLACLTLFLLFVTTLFVMFRTLIRHLEAIYLYFRHKPKLNEIKLKHEQHVCVCTKVFENDLEYFKNQIEFTCLYCDISFEKPTTTDVNGEEFKLILMDKHRHVLCQLFTQLEAMSNEYNEKILEFSLKQADHFENLRRDVDIARETLLLEMYETNKYNGEYLEQIQKQSEDMIKQIELLEEAFRLNFNNELKKTQVNLTSTSNIENLKDLDLSQMKNLKATFVSLLERSQRNLNRFKLFEYDLVRNKFDAIESNSNASDKGLGRLCLFKNFLTDDSQHVITCAKESYEIEIWDVGTSSLISKPFNKITCFILDETTKIFCGYKYGDISIWDITKNKQLTNLKGHDKSVCCLKLLDSNRNHLASGSSDARILIWDCSTSSRLHTLDGHHDGSWVACLADLPSGFLVSGGGCFDGRIKVWDITKNKSIHSLKDFKKKGDWNQIYSLKALPQSQDLFVSSSSDDVIKIWNALLGRCVKILYGHTNAVTDLEFNLSNQLLSCSKDGSIRIWEIKNVLLSVKCVRVLKGGFEQPEACLRMNKTNGKLLSGSKGAIRIWNMETGQCEHTIQTEHSITNMELCLCY